MVTTIAKELNSKVQPVLSSVVDKSQEPKDRLPFLIAGIANKDEVLFLGFDGLKDITDENSKVSQDTKFHFFSTSKAIVCTLLFILIEKGAIDSIDDPVEKYDPEINEIKVLTGFNGDDPIFVEQERKVTLKHLVTHTSGFCYDFFNENLDKWRKLHKMGPSLESVTWEEYKTPMVFQPGTNWLYGTSIDWVGRVIELVSGQTLDAFMKENIFKPLGMNSTSFIRTDEDLKRQAMIHDRNLDNGSLTPNNGPFAMDPPLHCAGIGLFGTCEDYLKFLQIFLNGGSSPSGVRILKSETVEDYFLKDQLVDDLAGIKLLPLKDLSKNIEMDPNNPPRTSWTVAWEMIKDPLLSGRGAPSYTWSGVANLYYFLDLSNGIVGYFATSVFPFMEDGSVKAYKKFEKAVYEAVNGSKST